MTSAEILAVQAGREMDALVWAMLHGGTVPRPGEFRWEHMPCYSTDVAGAWAVLERMRAEGWDFELVIRGSSRAQWRATFSQRVEWSAYGSTAPEAICRAASAYGSTAPEAICRAALLCAEARHE